MGESVTFQLKETFESVGPCCRCGITIVMPQHFANKRREDHADFHCPNGHAQHFPGKSELEKAQDLLATERRWREQANKDRDAALKRESAAKGQVTKIKNRVGNGVCPCCNRSFTNLQRHMHTKHPTFKDEGAT